MKKGIILFLAMLLMANYLPAQKYGYRFQSEFIELHPTRDAVTLIQNTAENLLPLLPKRITGNLFVKGYRLTCMLSIIQKILSPQMFIPL